MPLRLANHSPPDSEASAPGSAHTHEGVTLNPIAHPRESFPLASECGRVPHSSDTPSGPVTRPWILRFAIRPDSQQATALPPALYDEDQQISVGVDTDLLPYMATHSPTVPDGSVSNPPPLDEGTKD
jgi:putative ATP-grasp target RiPP